MLVSPISMPSLSSSPWMRGAPHSGFSRLIVRISFRTSLEIGGLPDRPWRTFQVQNRRKPLRCHAITVSGLTMTMPERQSAQTRVIHDQKSRFAGQFRSLHRTLEYAELVAESEDLKL
jgi:hypothetical protein